MVCLISAGGTGGHIFPGIALFEEMRDRGHDVFFLGGERDRRFEVIERLGQRFLPLPAAPLYRKRPWRNFRTVFVFVKALRRCLRLVRALHPAVCVGMGGYVTGPLLLACILKRVPIVLCEQNAVPGFANRRFASRAARIILNFPAQEHFSRRQRSKCLVLGNPVRPGFEQVERAAARRFFGLKGRRPVLGITGGSQGARAINEAVAGMASSLRGWDILWSTGAASHEDLAARVQGARFQLWPFVERMDLFFCACDLVVSRAGATTLAEIAATGTPALLVPYPFATADHQTRNAGFFRDKGAAVVVPEGEEFQERLAQQLKALLKDRNLLQHMAERAASLHDPKTLSNMASLVEDVVAGKEHS